MHSLSSSFLNTNERFCKQLPSPRISHETVSKINKPSAIVLSSETNSKFSRKKPPLKIAIVQNNSHCNNIVIDHVKTELVELINSKFSGPDSEKAYDYKNITISSRPCCFATPTSATFFTVKSATTSALNSLSKPFTPLRDQTSCTPCSPTTTFELNSSSSETSNSDDNSICRGAVDVAANNFGALAGSAYNFNFFEVTDIVSPVNAAHEYSLKLGELLASLSSPNNDSPPIISLNSDGNETAATLSAAPLSPRLVSAESIKHEQPHQLPPESSNSIPATCITPARTHFLFSKIAGNIRQPAQQTICEEPDPPALQSQIQLQQQALLSSLSNVPSSSPLEQAYSIEQPAGVYDSAVVVPDGETNGSHQYQVQNQYQQHYQIEVQSSQSDYFVPIIIPQQQLPTLPIGFTNPSMSTAPAYFNFQAHATFVSPTFGVFTPQQSHMQHLDPECIVLPLHQQASQHAVSPTDQPQQYENYYYQDQQAMAHQIQQPPCGQNYTVQPSAETGYGPCCSSLSGSASPCSSETFYEASICSQNSPLAEDGYTNKCQDDDDEGMRGTPQSDPEKKKKKKKKPRENKAWTNPMVTAGVHVSLMHENSLRVEKALPGKKGKYFCSHCKGQFRTILDLCAHMDAVSVRRPFHCPDTDCPWHVAGFPTASEWCRHTRFQHHRGEGKDVEKLGCESCGKKFTRKDSLKRHYILVHENENSRYNSKLRKQEERRFKKKKKRQQRQQSCSV